MPGSHFCKNHIFLKPNLLIGKLNTPTYNEIIFEADLVKICNVGNILKKEIFLCKMTEMLWGTLKLFLH